MQMKYLVFILGWSLYDDGKAKNKSEKRKEKTIKVIKRIYVKGFLRGISPNKKEPKINNCLNIPLIDLSAT